MNWLEALILALIEGLTEFLPVSSTGHMIIGSSLMGIANDDFTKLFTVAIQFGAILSVVVIYFRSFLKSWSFYAKLFVAFIPTAVVGLLVKDHIDALLDNVWVVATSLVIGGIVLLFVDKLFERNERAEGKADMPDPGLIDNDTSTLADANSDVTYKKGIVIGIFQCIAMIPGVSRSAATIIGGMTQGLTRKAAAEFSFFLAVPTMFAATAKSLYDIWKEQPEVITDNMPVLLVGNVVAFIVAILAIKLFIGVLTKYGFRVFGYYRIALGLVLLILLMTGVNLQIVD
jgi:undecaprenyl-diphosphatase